MSVGLIITLIVAYFLLLIAVAWFTSRGASNQDFYLGGKKSPWYIVAFGMIGASLSGVTFISVPGWPGLMSGVKGAETLAGFNYFQMVLGYVVGYVVIAFVLLPLYYKLNLTSIYTYLGQRLGRWSYKTGAAFFLLSRIVGASFRLYLVAIVLQIAIFGPLGLDVPFLVPVFITVALIWLYTFKGGIKTIIWTDTLQTFFMLAAVLVTIVYIASELDLSGFGEIVGGIADSNYSQMFFFDNFLGDSRHFVKSFLAGAFVTIAMTGLDQDMMQKNLSCKNLKEAQWNVLSLSLVLIVVNLFFLGLGALLYMYADSIMLPAPAPDQLYPLVALFFGLPAVVGAFLILGLIASAYSSADSALTALTTSFCVDMLETDKIADEKKAARTRKVVHVAMSLVLVLVISSFRLLGDDSVVKNLFKLAGYTYGPLLGLYAYGLFTQWSVKDNWVPLVCLIAPVISYFLATFSTTIFFGYQIGFELLPINGLITFLLLLLISRGKQKVLVGEKA